MNSQIENENAWGKKKKVLGKTLNSDTFFLWRSDCSSVFPNDSGQFPVDNGALSDMGKEVAILK